MKSYFTLFLFIILFLSQNIRAQRVLSYGIKINPGFSGLQTKSPSGLSKFSSQGYYSLNCGIFGNYYLNKKASIYTGIELYTYKFSIKGDDYFSKFNAIDSENKNYERQILGKDINELTKISIIQIPICYQYEYALNREIHLFCSLGPSFAFPVTTSLQGSGVFTYKGYYKEGNYTLENIPLYGFNSNVEVHSNSNLNNHFVSIHAIASIGCTFNINRHLKCITIVNYTRSLTSVVNKRDTQYHISNSIGSYESILANQAHVNNLTIGIGLQKELKF